VDGTDRVNERSNTFEADENDLDRACSDIHLTDKENSDDLNSSQKIEE